MPRPGHDAGDRSLSVKPDKDDAEGFVVHSFADDDFKACRDYVRAKLGLPEPKKNGTGKAWTLISEHIYLRRARRAFLKVRKCRDGDGNKQYPQYHWDGNGWAKGKPERPKIPYRLPQLIAAPTAGIVYLCEGEKDSDAFASSASWPPPRPRAPRPGGLGANAIFQGSTRRDPARRRSARPCARAEGRQGDQWRRRIGADSRPLSRAARRIRCFELAC